MGIMTAEMGQAHIKAGILILLTELVDQQTGIANGLIIGADPLDFKQIEGSEQIGYCHRDGLSGQLSDNEDINAITAPTEFVFCHVFERGGVIF